MALFILCHLLHSSGMRPYFETWKMLHNSLKKLFLVFVETTLCNPMKQSMYGENVWNSDYVHMTMADQQWASRRCCMLQCNPALHYSQLFIDNQEVTDRLVKPIRHFSECFMCLDIGGCWWFLR